MIKVGILTYHRSENYGAFLQAYGLCQRLNEELDIEAEIIDFRMKLEYDIYSHRNYRKLPAVRHLIWIIRHFSAYSFKRDLLKSFQRGYEKAPFSEESLISDRIEDFQNFVHDKYDIIIAGSDEIWKVDGMRGFPTPYWLPGDLGCKKFSYAASSRNDFSELNKDIINKIKEYLDDFSFISVRDDLTKYNIQKYIQPKAKIEVFSDPSFVYDYKVNGQMGRELLAKRAKVDPSKKICLVMMENERIAEQIHNELSLDYQLIAVFTKHQNYISLSNLDPFEWLNAIAGADLVCASYFHAICFSIINQTPFIAFAADGKASKLEAVLKSSGNMERYILEQDVLSKKGSIIKKVIETSENRFDETYVVESRTRFEEYISLLRTL